MQNGDKLSSLKQMYDNELTEIRKMLDDQANQKSKLELDVRRLSEENHGLKNRLKEAYQELNSIKSLESRYNQALARCRLADAEKEKANRVRDAFEDEIFKLQATLNDLRKHLEEETLARVEAENKARTLCEELTFKNQLHSEQMNEFGKIEISDLSKQYDAKLQKQLNELRNEYEVKLHANRVDMEKIYETKLKIFQDEAFRVCSTSNDAIKEIGNAREKMKQLNDKIAELEGQLTRYQGNDPLNTEIPDLDALRQGYEDEINHLREAMVQHLQEYKELLDIKTSLDLEIGTFGKLIGEEEKRLNVENICNLEDEQTVSLT